MLRLHKKKRALHFCHIDSDVGSASRYRKEAFVRQGES